jgi:multisubunit Na+/H+ antiporter MnhB subunit
MVDYTQVLGNNTSQELMDQIHTSIVIPNLLIVYLSTVLLILLFGKFSIRSKEGFAKFFWIWVMGFIVSGIIVAVLIFNQGLVLWVVDLFKTS